MPHPRRGLTGVKKVPTDLGPMPRVALAWLRGLCALYMASSFEVESVRRSMAKSPGLQMQTQPGATPQRARASSPLPMQSLHWLCTGMSVVSFVR